jgi:hypothetical protein
MLGDTSDGTGAGGPLVYAFPVPLSAEALAFEADKQNIGQ